ncbi:MULTISPECIES: hypothetical protein [unclassified Leptolyngbya]|uniref:hypothetical protein n=1 Tax=unclassified Leptolyngbya TaxID=2650499 RepID=UPI001684EFDC|nr:MULTISPECIES: hypothetical protein [unclassified Leptolyngbya]MBD1910779.1 hypothetical protein [Leptolyngbya sp. FACHB-8]MBD2158855.1 hypothetical protein [Leptolyngbya sp. FACHB-16]
MHYLVWWAIAFLCFAFGFRSREEVLRLTGAGVGSMVGLYGLTAAPVGIQLTIESLALVSISTLYLRRNQYL